MRASTSTVRPLLKWAGGKRQLLPILANYYPQKFSRYIEPFMGSADIQSLADLANSFEVVRTMRFVPFTKETVFQLGVLTLAPLTPLLLTMISLEELLKRLLTAVF
jgi:hypothetical protein